MRVGIIAALPGELKHVVRGWERVCAGQGSGLSMWRTRRGDDDLVAVCGGMGPEAAGRAFALAERDGRLEFVITLGWAGATKANFVPGACFAFAEIIDAQTGERFAAQGGGMRLKLVSSAQVASVAEKKRIWDSYLAGAVDMEAATVARLARMRGIPLVCIKAISDGVDSELPDFNRFIDTRGQMRMGAFLAHVAVRPGTWRPLAYLGMQSAAGAKAMAKAVDGFLLHKDVGEMLGVGGIGG